MIVFAAITPHTPLLLKTIVTEHEKALVGTRKAFEALKLELRRSRPETIIILSPHGTILPDAFAVNLCDEYRINFKEFGDLGTTRRFHADLSFIDETQRAFRKKDAPITLLSSRELDYGAGVPLALLTDPKQELRLVPFSRSGLDFGKHFAFGEALGDQAATSQKRIAIIASANLSHRLSSDSPVGFSPGAASFDQAIQSALGTKNTSSFLTLDPELVKEAQPCGFRIILLLLGMLKDLPVSPRLLSYEHPFGIGYLTVNFSPLG